MKIFLLSISIFLLLLPPVAARTVLVVDSDGTEIEPIKAYSRIISLYTAHTENLLALGLDKEIIAVSRADKSLARTKLSYRDDPERFLALAPDLVLIRPMISRAYPQLITRLRKSGVTVVSLQPVSIKGMFDYWRTLGRLTGRQKEADAMVEKFNNELSAITKKVTAISPERQKRVYFEAIHRRMKTFAPSSMAMFVLTSAGGINVAADTKQLRNTNIAEYGKERILAKADEIDVFLAQKGRMNRISREEIIDEPGFQVIRAIGEGQVFLIDEKLVSRPTMGLITGIHQVFNILYGKQ